MKLLFKELEHNKGIKSKLKLKQPETIYSRYISPLPLKEFLMTMLQKEGKLSQKEDLISQEEMEAMKIWYQIKFMQS